MSNGLLGLYEMAGMPIPGVHTLGRCRLIYCDAGYAILLPLGEDGRKRFNAKLKQGDHCHTLAVGSVTLETGPFPLMGTDDLRGIGAAGLVTGVGVEVWTDAFRKHGVPFTDDGRGY